MYFSFCFSSFYNIVLLSNLLAVKVHTFLKGISLKENVTSWLQFELTTMLHFSMLGTTIRVSPNFGKILAIWSTVWQFLMLSSTSWKQQIKLDCEMSRDTLWVLLSWLASIF